MGLDQRGVNVAAIGFPPGRTTLGEDPPERYLDDGDQGLQLSALAGQRIDPELGVCHATTCSGYSYFQYVTRFFCYC